jgi:DNA (cytosine-5)-methyltransferase 1
VDHTEKLTHISLCTGYGGIDLGLERALGAVRTVTYVEIEAFVIENLVAKIEAGLLDPAPIYSNLKTFPWKQFAGRVDILSGGFPCQPFSGAGRRAGDEDPRHLFPYIMQGVRELGRPPIVFLENVEGTISSKLKGDEWADPEGTSVLLHVLRELERVGYEAEAGVFSAREIGAPHQRKRVFIMGVRSDLSDTGRDTVSAILRATERGGWKPTKVSAAGNAKHNGRTTSKIRRGDDTKPTERREDGENIASESTRAGGLLQVLSTERGDVGNAPRWDVQCSYGRGRPKQKTTQAQDRESSTAYPAPRGAEQHEWEPPRVTTMGDTLDKGLQGGIPTMEPRRSQQTYTESALRPSSQQHIHGKAEPPLGGNAHGASDWLDYAELCHSVDNRTDELRMLGNGVVPETAERAFRELWGLVNATRISARGNT